MKNNIFLGYEIDSGKKIEIPLAHTVITGLTNKSGKTTALMTLLKNSERKCIIFKTKIGEKALTEGTIIPPFFRDRSDWEFIISIIEATTRQRIIIEKGTIMKLSAGTCSLLEVLRKIQEERATEKLKGIKEEIYIRLENYLQKVIPQIQYSNFSKTLTIFDGINIMDLEKFTEEVQSLIITSVLNEVLNNHRDILIVIPEFWKFAPEGKYETPVKLELTRFIRQGATNGNFLFLDSQDIASTSKEILKQVSNWILGLQTEINEVKHTLDQLPVPKKSKPKEDEIMTLKIGHFFFACPEFVTKLYAQPIWMESKIAKEIAMGKKDVKDVKEPFRISEYDIARVEKEKENYSPAIISEVNLTLQKELAELRTDFFNKVMTIDEKVNNIGLKLSEVEQQKPQINEDVIISKILQKIPLASPQTPNINMDAVINQVIARIPKTQGAVVYEVAPLEKIKKDFLEEAKNRILSDIQSLTDDEKKALKYLESKDVDVTPSELIIKCFLLKAGGSSSVKISNILKSLLTVEAVEKTAGGRYKRGLRKRIEILLANHGATEQEINQVLNHIIMEILK